MVLPTRLARTHLPALAAHFAALSDDDLRLRFGRAMTEAGIAQYLQSIDFARDALFGVFDTGTSGTLTLLGVAHLAPERDDGRALELGLSVRPDGRRRGVAQCLLSRAITHARAQGAETLKMDCVSDNTPMRRLALRAGMTLDAAQGDLHAQLPLVPPSAATLWAVAWADLLEDSVGAADYALRASLTQALAAIQLHASMPPDEHECEAAPANDPAATPVP